MKKAAILAAVLLVGCATPPGQLTPDGMSNYTRGVAADYPTVVEGFRDYSRRCGDILGYIPEWHTKSDKTIVDLYLRMAFGGRSNEAFGIIEVAPKEASTQFSMGVVKLYSNPLFKPADWWRPKIDEILAGIERGELANCQ